MRKRIIGLTLIVWVLLAVLFLRLEAVIGKAIAESGIAPDIGKDITTPATSCDQAPDTASLLNAISARQVQLDNWEKQIDDRLQAIAVAEKQLEEHRVTLVAAEQKLAQTLAIADKAAEDDLQRLTSVYESMKPKNAAGLFAEMAPEFAAGFLGRMRAEAAASILSSMPPEKAYAISLNLAGRNAGSQTN